MDEKSDISKRHRIIQYRHYVQRNKIVAYKVTYCMCKWKIEMYVLKCPSKNKLYTVF
jgi:hypothetical protein